MSSRSKLKLIPAHSKNNVFLVLLGYISFAALFILSIYFYKERVLFSDSVYQFFKIINFEKINIEASRYGAILPELPVLFAINFLGINLKWLTILYSVSFIFVYFIVFIICTHFLKNRNAGLAIILVLILCIRQSFFHPVTETHQALVYSILLYAILSYDNFKYNFTRIFLSIIIAALAFTAHPVALYTIIFVTGYVTIHKKRFKTIEPYILLIFILSITFLKIILTNEDSYEGRFFAELFNSPEILLTLYKANSTKFILSRIGTLYLWLTILEISLTIFLVRDKKYLKLAWHLCISAGFILVSLITYHKGDATLLMERSFMPLALFVSIPFLQEIYSEKSKFLHVKTFLLAMVIFISLNRIYQQGLEFKNRTQFNQELLKKTANYPNKKFIIPKSDLDKHVTTFWSNSFESLILSTIDINVPTQTIYPGSSPKAYTKYTNTNNNSTFLGTDFWLEWNIKDLNPKYFSFPTDKPYKYVNLDEL